MSGLDLDALERDAREVADMRGPLMSADADDIVALITRLRAAEARADSLRAGLERVVKRCAEGGEQALAEAQCALDWDDDAIPAAPEAP